MIINKSSWHYKVFTWDSHYRRLHTVGICKYVRIVLLHLAIITFIVSSIGIGLPLAIGGTVVSALEIEFASLWVFLAAWLAGVLLTASLIAIMISVGYIINKIIEQKIEREFKEKEDRGFIYLSYKSFKDKICPIAEIVGK